MTGSDLKVLRHTFRTFLENRWTLLSELCGYGTNYTEFGLFGMGGRLKNAID